MFHLDRRGDYVSYKKDIFFKFSTEGGTWTFVGKLFQGGLNKREFIKDLLKSEIIPRWSCQMCEFIWWCPFYCPSAWVLGRGVRCWRPPCYTVICLLSITFGLFSIVYCLIIYCLLSKHIMSSSLGTLF